MAWLSGADLQGQRARLQKQITRASSWINGKAFNHRYTTHTVPFTYTHAHARTHVDEGGRLMSSCLVIHWLMELQSNSIRISLSLKPAKSWDKSNRGKGREEEREQKHLISSWMDRWIAGEPIQNQSGLQDTCTVWSRLACSYMQAHLRMKEHRTCWTPVHQSVVQRDDRVKSSLL